MEQSYSSKISALVKVQDSAIKKLTRKTTINVLRRGTLEDTRTTRWIDRASSALHSLSYGGVAITQTVSSPVNVRRMFSVSTDWQWSSDQDPLEVFEFIEEVISNSFFVAEVRLFFGIDVVYSRLVLVRLAAS